MSNYDRLNSLTVLFACLLAVTVKDVSFSLFLLHPIQFFKAARLAGYIYAPTLTYLELIIH